MNCKDFESTVHEVVSRQAADKTKQLAALEHAGHCLSCARRLDEETKLTQRLQAFAVTLQGQRASVRVEEELLRAFRERTSRRSAPLTGHAWKQLWHGLSWGLALAAIVVTAWIVVFQWPRLHPGSRALPSGVTKKQSPPSEVSRTDIASREVGARTAPESGAYAWRSRPAALGEFTGEVATNFISLGTCDDSQCMDEAMLVRMSLPAEALLAFGVGTGNEYAPNGFVNAEVALGSDGVPFAIRFVD